MIDTVLFAGFAVAYLVILGWGGYLIKKRGHVVASDLVLLVVAGLVYDNALLASGQAIGEGVLLERLNAARFWIHAFATPLLVVFAWHACARTEARWARAGAAPVVAILAALALVILELVTVVFPLELQATRDYGVLSYADTGGPSGPPLMVLFIAAALIAAGVVVWRRQGWVWLLIGSVIMTIGSAVPIPVESGAITNLFELVLLVSIVATIHFQDDPANAG